MYSTSIPVKTAGSEEWYRSISGCQLYLVPQDHAHISMNQLLMTIGCALCRGPWEACYELHVCTCVRSAVHSRFALLPIIPLLHHNVPQQKQATMWLDSLFSRVFTWIQTVIDVEGGMAPYMWHLVERPGGAFNFFPSLKSSHR